MWLRVAGYSVRHRVPRGKIGALPSQGTQQPVSAPPGRQMGLQKGKRNPDGGWRPHFTSHPLVRRGSQDHQPVVRRVWNWRLNQGQVQLHHPGQIRHAGPLVECEEQRQPIGHFHHAAAEVLVHPVDGVGGVLEDRLPLLRHQPPAPPEDVGLTVLHLHAPPGGLREVGCLVPSRAGVAVVAGVRGWPLSSVRPHDRPMLGQEQGAGIGKLRRG